MKYLLLMLMFMAGFESIGRTALFGDICPMICIEKNKFYLYSPNNMNKTLNLKVFSVNGKLENAIQLDLSSWPRFYSYRNIKKQTSSIKNITYCLKFPASILIVPKIDMRKINFEKLEETIKEAKNYIQINAKLSKLNKIQVLTGIFVDSERLILLGFPMNSSELFLYVFDVTDLRFTNAYKIGTPDRYFSSVTTTSVLKYLNGYIILWQSQDADLNDSTQAPLYLTYLNLQNKTIATYKVLKDASASTQLTAGLINDNLLFAYTQYDIKKKYISKIKTKFLNLKQLLKQKSISIFGPKTVGVGKPQVPNDD